MIRYLTHKEIDKAAYDACIESASNEMIYAYSWYLDLVAPSWGLLVKDKYDMVMPLPGKQKIGIRYVHIPWFSQQLGIFGKNTTPADTDAFISSIPKSYKLIELKLNEQNSTSDYKKNTSPSINYILELEKDYAQTSKKYNRNCRRNLKKATESGLSIFTDLSPKEFSEYVKQHLEKQVSNLSKTQVLLLEKLTATGIKKEVCELIGVKNKKGEIYAVALFFFTKKRVIFSVCASSSEGKKKQAMALLVDHQINTYADKYEIFDFSGSQIKGIAYFNSTFGARSISFPKVYINRLRWFQKILSGKK